MTIEGRVVSYVGDVGAGLPDIGDKGRVLSSDGTSCHVMWATGSRHHQVDLLPIEAVVLGNGTPVRTEPDDLLEDSFVGMRAVAVVETYEADGAAGVLNALAEAGSLSSFAQIAEDAAAHVAARLWEDDDFRQVLAQLDPEDGAALVSLASVVLLRDAFGGEGE